jgi:hypothetical protein
MITWSKETIQKTLDCWGPDYAKHGEILTEEDAREILDNVTGLFDLLHEIGCKYRIQKVFSYH